MTALKVQPTCESAEESSEVWKAHDMEQASQVIVLASALLIWAAMSRSCCHSSCAMPGGSRASRTCSCRQVNRLSLTQ